MNAQHQLNTVTLSTDTLASTGSVKHELQDNHANAPQPYVSAHAPSSINTELRTEEITALVSSDQQLKKAYRILKELNHDARKLFPLMPVPSTWILRCLLEKFYRGNINSSWRESIVGTLHTIKDSVDPTHNDSTVAVNLYERDGKTPLFPNKDNFSLASTHLYASTMLRYLKAKDLHDKCA